jgi:hypothetical protein
MDKPKRSHSVFPPDVLAGVERVEAILREMTKDRDAELARKAEARKRRLAAVEAECLADPVAYERKVATQILELERRVARELEAAGLEYRRGRVVWKRKPGDPPPTKKRGQRAKRATHECTPFDDFDDQPGILAQYTCITRTAPRTANSDANTAEKP